MKKGTLFLYLAVLSTCIILPFWLTATCGVYSTPQVVILNGGHTLYYSGNYNKNRYCTNKKLNYTHMAMDALLAKQKTLVFKPYALTADGWSLPNCTR